jgi:threonine dehydrogenase-like Zn-dependent dehydrogenase
VKAVVYEAPRQVSEMVGVQPGDQTVIYGPGPVGPMTLLSAVKTELPATQVMPPEDGPRGYRIFKNKEDGCVRAVLRPSA